MEVYLTSSKMEGHIIAVYETLQNGETKLGGLLLPDSPLTDAQFRYLMDHLSYDYPENGKVCGLLNCSLSLESAEELVKAQSGKEKRNKIALFCGMYKKYFNINYTVMPQDAKLAGRHRFDKRLLDIFFETEFWWNKDRRTISCYCSNINTLELIATGDNRAGKFPNKYSPDFEKSVSGAILVEYWKHLRELGWKAIKHEASNKIICWSNGIESINTK